LAQTNTQKRLLVGKISGLFGIKGWVKVFSYCDPIENICCYNPWIIDDQELQIQSKKHSKTIIAKLPDIDTPEDARVFLGKEIYINIKQLPKLKDSYYYYQLEGLKVVNTKGFVFGKVDYLFDNGANSVMVVPGETLYYIPLIEPYLINVDLASGIITVDWDKDF
jgi:16S rRNA processing protein RimM